jgi:hypothetical protein
LQWDIVEEMEERMKNGLVAFAIIAFILSACSVTAAPTLDPGPLPTSTSTTAPTAATIVTSVPTNTPAPAATSSPDGTPTPVSTFPAPYDKMSNPALDLVDIRISEKDGLMTAIFYMKDVPSELTFNKAGGVEIGSNEYMWQICVDTDNNKNTGAAFGFSAGSDYCLSATHIKSSHNPRSMPIEQGVQVSVRKLSGTQEKSISSGTINVDTAGNTLGFSGQIPGITSSSLFYYEVYDGDYGALDISGPLYDRLLIEQ